MKIRNCRSWNWALVAGIFCFALMIASLSFGEEPPLQQNRPAPGGRNMRAAPQQSMPQGMPDRGMAPAQGPGMMPGGPAMDQKNAIGNLLQPEVQKELAFTAEQRQKLEDLQFNNEKERIQHHASLQILKMDLDRLAKSDNPDRTAIDKKVQEIAQEEAFLLRSSINARLNARAILTAEQRTKLEQIMQNRGMEERMPRGMGMRQNQPFPGANQQRGQIQPPVRPENP
jgi:Spy/CpxP family protein refolding chaperone